MAKSLLLLFIAGLALAAAITPEVVEEIDQLVDGADESIDAPYPEETPEEDDDVQSEDLDEVSADGDEESVDEITEDEEPEDEESEDVSEETEDAEAEETEDVPEETEDAEAEDTEDAPEETEDVPESDIAEDNERHYRSHKHYRRAADRCTTRVAYYHKLRVKGDARRAKEHKLLNDMKRTIRRLANVKSEQLAEMAEQLSLVQSATEEERKHAEVHGRGGVLALINSLIRRLHAEAKRERAIERHWRTKCDNICVKAVKHRQAVVNRSERAHRHARAVERTRAKQYNLARGKYAALRKNYRVMHAAYVKAQRIRDQELRLLAQFDTKLTQLRNAKEETSLVQEEDAVTVDATALQSELAESMAQLKTLSGDAGSEFAEVMSEMQRNHPNVQRITVLIAQIRASINAEAHTERNNLRNARNQMIRARRDLASRRRALHRANAHRKRVARQLAQHRRQLHRSHVECARLTGAKIPSRKARKAHPYAHKCWLRLACPRGQKRVGDGSACVGANKPRCELGWCDGNPNGGTSCPPRLNYAGRRHAVKATAGAKKHLTQCWNMLPCPKGMKRYGDGSACRGGGKPTCDLGWCAGRPNGYKPCTPPTKRAYKCWNQLPCPAGMTRYGDGSACRKGNKRCDLGYCAKSPNRGIPRCARVGEKGFAAPARRHRRRSTKAKALQRKMVDSRCRAAAAKGTVYLSCLLGVKPGHTQAKSFKPFMTLHRHGGYALGADCAGRWPAGSNKKSIYLAGKGKFVWGVGAHSPSDFSYDLRAIRRLGARFSRFKATVGIDSKSHCTTTKGSTFIVYVDGRKKFQFSTASMKSFRDLNIHLPASAKTLRLRNLDYRGRYCNHAVWANAKLV
eukprot:CAMPEP_0114552440 /NCGR_PEP_ID=MMETSP0114-20121206/7125_1 /TAXON_ID=31324 /ORGANISM="Goniomonas sp, Strain m" /LENGTH=856 /DNA_ID=CAMNT_0001737315 /DNA_START=17 /DNA_END=2587 /DNA_ORIENTATION=+